MELHLSYIAGFLDGDGSITAFLVKPSASGRRPRLDVKIYFFNQNLEVLLFIKDVLGCGVLLNHKTSAISGCYRLDIPISDSADVLRKLIPYLRVKKRQAELALEARMTINPKGGRTAISGDIQSHRECLVEEIQRLNARDGKAYKAKWVNSVDLSKDVMAEETIPSQVAVGEGNVSPFRSAKGVTTRRVSPNNNPVHENPPRKG